MEKALVVPVKTIETAASSPANCRCWQFLRKLSPENGPFLRHIPAVTADGSGFGLIGEGLCLWPMMNKPWINTSYDLSGSVI